jgi:transcriptional regulator with XRE-family HTH domain
VRPGPTASTGPVDHCGQHTYTGSVGNAEPLPVLLKKLREERGKSLRAAARDLGVDPSYLYRVERGEKVASAELRERAAQFYDLPSEELKMAAGHVPEDILEILRSNPELVARLRKEYGDASAS